MAILISPMLSLLCISCAHESQILVKACCWPLLHWVVTDGYVEVWVMVNGWNLLSLSGLYLVGKGGYGVHRDLQWMWRSGQNHRLHWRSCSNTQNIHSVHRGKLYRKYWAISKDRTQARTQIQANQRFHYYPMKELLPLIICFLENT